MRFLHTSDWHLGRTLHSVDLLDAQRAVLSQICRLVAEPPDGIAIEAVLIAGDIYDRAVPPVEAVTLFASTLAQLTRHTTVIVTSGNHDSAIRLGFGAELFTERLRVRTELANVGSPVLLGEPDAPVAVYPLPYLDPDVARTVLAPGDQPLARSHQAVMSAATDRVRADLAARPAGTWSVAWPAAVSATSRWVVSTASRPAPSTASTTSRSGICTAPSSRTAQQAPCCTTPAHRCGIRSPNWATPNP
jgi:exonuclease SbcD